MSYNYFDGKVKVMEITEELRANNIELPGIAVPPVNAEAATVTTALTGFDNNLVYTAKVKGKSGDDISVTYVEPDDDVDAEVVTVAGADITVTLRKDGATLSTAAQVKAAVEDNAVANAMVSIQNAAGDNGTGEVTAMTKKNLEDGVDGTVGARGLNYIDSTHLYVCTADNTAADANWKRIELIALA